MPLSHGVRLGPYEILEAIGAGGMGEVYRAKDTRLDRTVAIKILPAHFSCDPVRKQRFEREAKTVSSLNHPHICVLYDVGSQDGHDYLVMECVEGETLARRLERGPLPLEQVLKYGMQIADALDKAHRSGVVHRDLKPNNIMLTPTGAKLLDFGLAKAAGPLSTAVTLTAATRNSPVTEQGAIVGTFPYMSPEQVEGKELDARSDLFSLGAVLYEMLTGQRAFPGNSQLSVASAILEKEPAPISTVKPMTPPALNHAIRRCLAKDPEERWQTARDLALELKWFAESAGQAAAPAVGVETQKTGAWLSLLPWVLCGVLAAGLLAGAMWWRGGKNTAQTSYFSAPFPFPGRDMAVAPNGHTVAVVALRESARTNVLWLYEVGGREARSLRATEGASFPFWSPDGKSLAFFADGKLKKVDIVGGPVQAICEAPSGRGGTWNEDGVIVFTPSANLIDGLYQVPASGGTPTQITVPDASREENSHRWPMFLPDGKHFLYLAANLSGSGKTEDAIYVGALDSKEKKFVTRATGNAAYAAPGYLLYYREKTLFAQRFDADKGELSGEAVPLLTDVAYLPRIRRVAYAASDGGVLVAQSGSGVSLSRLVWYDRKGNEMGGAGKPDVYANVALAPNGKTVALDKVDMGSQNTDVWTYDLQRDTMKRLTFDPAIDSTAVWSPDGTRLLFASNRGHHFGLYVKNADGAEEEKLLALEASNKVDKYPSDWSRDGKYILYESGQGLWIAAIPELKTRVFVNEPATVKNGQFSPDGRWVAYTSNESGKWEIYVTSFPEGRGKWQLSSDGGTQPRWRGDGRELFFLASDGKIMAVPVTAGANFDAGAPVTLFQANPRELVASSERVTYDVTKDGQRFLINTQVKNAETQPMSVILNWQAGLKK
jgi:eukaryotic-like serine/threonine-protein kinase